MAFGNLISEAVQIAAGTYGAIYAFNLKSLQIFTVKQVQMQDDNVLSTPSTAGVATSTLFSYPENESCPDFAFAQKGNVLYIFINSDVYSAASRVGMEFTRNSISFQTLVGRYLDIPACARNLMHAYCKKKLYEMDSKRISFDVEQNIISEKAKLGLS
jgi:hypothetical protein